jgi:aconitate hydratase
MGVLPLQFQESDTAASLGLTGFETFDIVGIEAGIKPAMLVTLHALSEDGKKKTFQAVTRIDTPYEIQYYKHGGILQYVLRQLIG